ncbi:ATP/maltotriose-dependent transcriptional regulator MalT [Mycolicibacterium mucogenicum 261Sha1.1M5]|nr:ATP/maltotriose-dependent transcriptional regulator MalT [Mycolicibacterium mucogenicum 261Sha1.1M5]
MHRNHNANAICEDVRRGKHVEVVGAHGSGKTTLIQRVQNTLQQDGWIVHSVQGQASFANHPLTALTVAGLVNAPELRPQPFAALLAAAVSDLAAKLPRGRSALFVDDWQQLDDASWGVIQAAAKRNSVPLVCTRLPVDHPGGSASRLSPLAGSEVREVRLRPLTFVELEQTLKQHLNGAIAPNTLSRIYAKTGGSPGLALALVDAATQVDKLRVVENEWHGAADLWNDTLAALARTLIDRLDGEYRDALEVLSLLGAVSVSRASELVDLRVLERLEDHGFIQLVPVDGENVVSVEPPLLAEYFRHEANHVRRFRLAKALESIPHPAQGAWGSQQLELEYDRPAQLVRLAHERIREEQFTAGQEWRDTPTLRSAARAVRALTLGIDRYGEEVAAIIAEAQQLTATEEEAFDWACSLADVCIARDGDVAAAIAALTGSMAAAGPYASALSARAAQLALVYFGDATQARSCPRPAADAPPRVHAELLATQGMLALVEGNVGASKVMFEERRELLESVPDATPDDATVEIFEGYAAYLSGDVAATIVRCLERFHEAVANLDVVSVIARGSLCATLLLLEGRHREASSVIAHTHMLGAPGTLPAFTRLSLATASAVLATRQGRKSAGDRTPPVHPWLHDIAVPLPGVSPQWAAVQALTSSGKQHDAAALAEQVGNTYWNQSARVAAAYAYLGALEAEPTHERLAALLPRLQQVTAPAVALVVEHTAARIAGDAPALADLAEVFAQQQRYSFAISSLRLAAEISRQSGEPAETAALERRLTELTKNLPTGQYDPRRGAKVVAELTSRELRIARLAQSGLSNQQIASDLVLSIRTVESHIYRIMRKLDIDRRADLAEYFAADA